MWGKPKRRLSSEPAVFITDQTQPTASLLVAAVCFMKPMKPEESLLLQHEVCFAKVVLAKWLCAVLHPIEPAIMKPVCSTLILGRSYRQHCDPAMICPHASLKCLDLKLCNCHKTMANRAKFLSWVFDIVIYIICKDFPGHRFARITPSCFSWIVQVNVTPEDWSVSRKTLLTVLRSKSWIQSRSRVKFSSKQAD